MKWIKVNQKTEEPTKRNCSSFEPHDYITDDKRYRIINNSFHERKNAFVLCTYRGSEIKKFDRLKDAKLFVEKELYR